MQTSAADQVLSDPLTQAAFISGLVDRLVNFTTIQGVKINFMTSLLGGIDVTASSAPGAVGARKLQAEHTQQQEQLEGKGSDSGDAAGAGAGDAGSDVQELLALVLEEGVVAGQLSEALQEELLGAAARRTLLSAQLAGPTSPAEASGIKAIIIQFELTFAVGSPNEAVYRTLTS